MSLLHIWKGAAPWYQLYGFMAESVVISDIVPPSKKKKKNSGIVQFSCGGKLGFEHSSSLNLRGKEVIWSHVFFFLIF